MKNNKEHNKNEIIPFDIGINLKEYLANNLHQKQMQFHANTKQNRWIFGGNRTGKTQCGAIEVLLWALCIHPHRQLRNATEGWVVSLSAQVQRDVAQQKILKYLNPDLIIEVVMQNGKKDRPERGVIDYLLVRNSYGTESKIGFRNCEQGREKFQGTGLDYVWFDEEPPLDVYEECLLRTLDRGGSVWGTMTPLKGRSWVYDTIFLNSDLSMISEQNINLSSNSISCVFMSWEDNPYLRAEEIKKMERTLSADVLESRKYGRFMEGTGLVFCEFSEENVIDPVPLQDGWVTMLSIDPGFANPTAVLWLAVDYDENIFVVADYSVPEKTVEYHAREIRRISEELGFPKNDEGGYDAIIDSAALQKHLGSERSVAEQFRKCGIAVSTKVNKSVNEGIMNIKRLFKNCDGRRKLFIFRNCTNLIGELRTYWWADSNKPVKRNDHCIDALRYFVATDLRSGKAFSGQTKAKNRGIFATTKNDFIRRNKSSDY